MALLSNGTPLTWTEASKKREFIKEHGIQQFIECFNEHKGRCGDARTFGHELEYMIVHGEDGTLWTGAAELIPILNEESKYREDSVLKPKFLTEYGSFMIECIPSVAFPEDMNEALVLIEPAVKQHREVLTEGLPETTKGLTLTTFPLLGLPEGTRSANDGNLISQSQYHVPDELINKHPRYATLTRNIRARRGSKVDIRVPADDDVDSTAIHMDAMVFGMGNCCLQVTFQAESMEQAMSLFDCLVPFTPLMMAVSAASPVFRGQMSGWDCRWNVVAMSVDDRTEEERKVLGKGRFSSISRYLGDDAQMYNDLDAPVHEQSYTTLKAAGVPENLARHVGHLFIRDPLVIFEELLKSSIDDHSARDHFENIQSTNWQSLRFKMPPEDGSGGWRVEFRVMDIQLDDHRNALLIAFLALLVRCILDDPTAWKRFLIPITRVDENMERAHLKDAVLKQKLHWRDGEESALEIFREVVPLMRKQVAQLDEASQMVALKAIRLVMDRAEGKAPTDARIIRDFYHTQPQGITRESFLSFLRFISAQHD